MKQLICTLLIAAAITGCCSKKKLNYTVKAPVNTETGKVDFTETFDVAGVVKKDLYSRGREWFARTYVSSKAVLEMDDKEAGKMIGKGIGRLDVPGNIEMRYVIAIYVKDGAVKYSMTDIVFHYDQYNSTTKRTTSIDTPAEDVITPDKVEKCPCITSRARTRWRDAAIKHNEQILTSLKKAMSKDSGF